MSRRLSKARGDVRAITDFPADGRTSAPRTPGHQSNPEYTPTGEAPSAHAEVGGDPTYPDPSSRVVDIDAGGLSDVECLKGVESVGSGGDRSGAEECSETQNTPRPEARLDFVEAVTPANPGEAANSPGHSSLAFDRGRPPEVVPTEAEARGLLKAYLKTNLRRDRGSMTTAARLFAESPACSPELREAILRELGPKRASKHQLPRTVKRAMMASAALVTYSRNPRAADVMFGHARGTLRRHWHEDRRLRAGESISADDGTINFAVCVPWTWGGCRCSDKFGVKVGRFQWLPVLDNASDLIIGWTYVIRASGSYRAEDVCGVLGRTMRDSVVPDVAVLERGTWESRRVTALLAAAGVEVNRSYAPRQKLIEGFFGRGWTVLSATTDGQVGRYRGEMERENKLLAQAQAGTLDPRTAFVDVTAALAALEHATQFLGRTPIESRQYGNWIPEQRWREDLAAHPRKSLDPSLSFLWAPEVRTWTARKGCVGGSVEQPLGVTLPSHWWAAELLQVEGRKVTAHFDPWETQAPATLTLAEDFPQRGWKAGRVIADGVPCLEDLPTISRDAANALTVQFGEGDVSGALARAKQMRSTLRSIVLREYRAVSATGSPARRETEVRAPDVNKQATGDRAPAPAIVNRSSRVLTDDETDVELARIEARERRLRESGVIPISF